jgi:hypothetical protein
MVSCDVAPDWTVTTDGHLSMGGQLQFVRNGYDHADRRGLGLDVSATSVDSGDGVFFPGHYLFRQRKIAEGGGLPLAGADHPP